MGKFKDLTGMKFDRWTVNEYVGRDKGGKLLWKVKCDCGNDGVVRATKLYSGHSKSCGCLRREVARNMMTSHGMGNTPTHRCWMNMKNRCYNSKHQHYLNYGGRGIRVCERWLNSFENFLEDMGECPEGMSIDRMDNNGNYTPENCRWATDKEQSRNKRSNAYITHSGVTMCLADWADELGINPRLIYCRRHRGWSPEDCLFGRTKSKPTQEDSDL